MSDRIAVMREGRFVEVGTPGALWANPRTVFAAQFLGGANIFSGEAQSESAGRPSVPASACCARHARPGAGVALRPPGERLAGRPAAGPNRFLCRVVSQRFLGDAPSGTATAWDGGPVLGCRTRTVALSPDVAVTAFIDPEHLKSCTRMPRDAYSLLLSSLNGVRCPRGLERRTGASGVLFGLSPVLRPLLCRPGADDRGRGLRQRAARRALAGAWPLACVIMMGISRRGGLGRQSAAIARDRGVTAIVVDGNVRDIADLRASGPPYRGA